MYWYYKGVDSILSNIFLSLLAIVSVIWFSFITSLSRHITEFDVINKKIRVEQRLLGINIKDGEFSLETSRLLGEKDRGRIILYLIDSNEKRYPIGLFGSNNLYEKHVREILQYVPIQHAKNF